MARIIGIILPASLPIGTSKTLGTVTIEKISTGICIPMKIPISIGGYSKTGGISTPYPSPLKISMIEKAKQIKTITLPINERAWDFKGVVLSETIVDYTNTSFTFFEDIRARILTDIYMKDKNHVCVSWYGQPVNEVMILRKSRLNDEYLIIDTVPWDKGEYILEVAEDATNIKLEGTNKTGESSIILLEDGFNTEIKTDIKIAINIKVHYFNINRDTVYRLKVNY